MAARRGLSFLGALIALLVAAVGAAWLWWALATGQPLNHLASAALVVLIALTFAARCVVHLVGTLSGEAASLHETADLHDAVDPRFTMLRDDSGAATHDPHGVACPWCEAPLRRAAERCPSCNQAL
jgi:hypothetical protein